MGIYGVFGKNRFVRGFSEFGGRDNFIAESRCARTGHYFSGLPTSSLFPTHTYTTGLPTLITQSKFIGITEVRPSRGLCLRLSVIPPITPRIVSRRILS